MMDEYITAARLAAEEMEAWREDDYELLCELQQKRSEIRLEIRLDYEEEDEPIE